MELKHFFKSGMCEALIFVSLILGEYFLTLMSNNIKNLLDQFSQFLLNLFPHNDSVKL